MFNHFNETSITLTYKPYKDNTKKKKGKYRPVLLITIYINTKNKE